MIRSAALVSDHFSMQKAISEKKKYIFVNNSDYCCCMLARQAKILLT
jgi:hypothetical protein